METIEQHLEYYFQERETLSKEKIVSLIKEDFPNWAESTINMYLSKLKREGKIGNPSRGIYELSSKQEFNPAISSTLKNTYAKIKKEYPYINFCIWDSAWLNDLMRHQPFKRYTIIEVEKEASEAVFLFLNQHLKNVYLNPTEEIFDKYINNINNAVIIKNLISEAPLHQSSKIFIPTLEKILVDIAIDKDLFSAQQNEMEFIMKTAMGKYSINESKMKRYALRRNREIENLIKAT